MRQIPERRVPIDFKVVQTCPFCAQEPHFPGFHYAHCSQGKLGIRYIDEYGSECEIAVDIDGELWEIQYGEAPVRIEDDTIASIRPIGETVMMEEIAPWLDKFAQEQVNQLRMSAADLNAVMLEKFGTKFDFSTW